MPIKTLILVLVLVLSSCSREPLPPKEPFPSQPKINYMKVSFYGQGDNFHGKRTASGEIFDKNKLTAAHRTLPFGTCLRLTNPDNDQNILVRINDRGPFVRGRDLDISWASAKALGFTGHGVTSLIAEEVKSCV